MLNVSNEYKNIVISPMRQFLIKVIINDQEIDSKYLKSIKIEEVSCSGDTISIGDVCSNAFELELFKLDKLVSFDLAKVVIKSGLRHNNEVEWVNLGTFYVNEVVRQEYMVKLSGYDLIKKLEVLYQPQTGIDGKITYLDILNNILAQCQVTLANIDLSEYEDIEIEHYYENISCKELLGYLAGLTGCNVRANRNNQLEFYWYQDCGFEISDNLIYQDSYQETLPQEITINSLTSGDDKTTYVCGTGSGITFVNPYMNQEYLDKIFLKVSGFSYQPCSFKWRGNPSIENSDVVSYNNQNVVITKQTLLLDGGFSSDVECIGKVDNEVVMKTSSPIDIKLNKLYDTLTDAFKQASATILGQQGGNMIIDLNDDGKPSGWTIMDTPTLEDDTKLWRMNQNGLVFSNDGGKTASSIALDFNGNLVANAITTGIIQGSCFDLNLTSGEIKIGERHDNIIDDPALSYQDGQLYIKNVETLKGSGNNNILKDSCGCFNDGSWQGDFQSINNESLLKYNEYGYAISLLQGKLFQSQKVVNGDYTISFICLNNNQISNYSLQINGINFSKDELEKEEIFNYTFKVTNGEIKVEFESDTNNACSIINLMVNSGEIACEWSLNSNEIWSDSVKIGRGIRISSSGSNVDFVAYANRIGFVNSEEEYVTTFDTSGIKTNQIDVSNKATILKLYHQTINNQVVVNVLSEVE